MNRLNLIRSHLKQSEFHQNINVEECPINSKIKIVTLNNQKNLNALSPEFGDAIWKTLQRLDQDDGTKVDND